MVYGLASVIKRTNYNVLILVFAPERDQGSAQAAQHSETAIERARNFY